MGWWFRGTSSHKLGVWHYGEFQTGVQFDAEFKRRHQSNTLGCLAICSKAMVWICLPDLQNTYENSVLFKQEGVSFNRSGKGLLNMVQLKFCINL